MEKLIKKSQESNYEKHVHHRFTGYTSQSNIIFCAENSNRLTPAVNRFEFSAHNIILDWLVNTGYWDCVDRVKINKQNTRIDVKDNKCNC